MRNFRLASTSRRPLDTSAHTIREPARVLVADSDPNTGRLLATLGEKEGYLVVSAEDGREAHRVLKSDSAFCAAVFDLTDGVEIVRYMKTEKRLMRIPVVVLGGEQGLKLIRECFAAGAIAFLPKPFTINQLRQTLRVAISSQTGKHP